MSGFGLAFHSVSIRFYQLPHKGTFFHSLEIEHCESLVRQISMKYIKEMMAVDY